jgi:hypothetical protein
MRGRRVTGNPAAAGSPAPVGNPAGSPVPPRRPAVLLVSDAFELSWRYQLPAPITLPPAAALALTALFTHPRPAEH